MGPVNKDLQKERDKCTFNIAELTHFYDGGKERTMQRKERGKIHDNTGRESNSDEGVSMAGLSADSYLPKLHIHETSILPNGVAAFQNHDAMAEIYQKWQDEGTSEDSLSHKGKYEECVRRSVQSFGLMRNLQLQGKMKITDYRHVLESILGSGISRDGSPLALHLIMFMPAILSQGTEEQQAHWLPRAWVTRIIGTYAQTELGHGTFIRGLETTATYDPSTEEFVLHSPTLTSYKWWPGGIGHTANYAIIVAQLYTKGESHGIHGFIVQIRDEETHELLPGVKVGDMGPKMGLQPVNNGYLRLDHVRIPRNNMLMKHAQVLKDGTYVKSSNQKLLYAAMVFVRMVIISDMANYLSRAVTIATRYSAVRRQTPSKEDGPELQILDYATHQHKLFINIAACYTIRIVSSKAWETYFKVNDEVAHRNNTGLGELHALACCLKAVVTGDAARGVEVARRGCGGNGYLQSSHLPQLQAQVAAACTYEGDNTVLLLQTARFLAKTWQRLDSVTLTPSVAYLKTASAQGFLDIWENSVEGIIKGLQVVAVRKVARSVEVMEQRFASGMALEDAWNMTSVQLEAAAEAHCRVILVSHFYEGISNWMTTASPPLRVVLKQLVELYAVYWALEKLVDLMKYTSISKSDADELQAWYEQLLAALRPNAVGLVDAFDLRDETLQSTLGAYDGRVYERLLEDVLKNPMNEDRVNPTFQKYLKPYMKAKL